MTSYYDLHKKFRLRGYNFFLSPPQTTQNWCLMVRQKNLEVPGGTQHSKVWEPLVMLYVSRRTIFSSLMWRPFFPPFDKKLRDLIGILVSPPCLSRRVSPSGIVFGTLWDVLAGKSVLWSSSGVVASFTPWIDLSKFPTIYLFCWWFELEGVGSLPAELWNFILKIV
jgi:hypothetical protein